MLLTNEGAVSVSYASWGTEPYGWAHAQTAIRWTNGELAPHFTGSSTLVRPHSSSTFRVWLPAGTLRWQCGFSVRSASIRERAAARMFDIGWWNRLSPLSDWGLRLLPFKTGANQEVQSDKYEVEPVSHNLGKP